MNALNDYEETIALGEKLGGQPPSRETSCFWKGISAPAKQRSRRALPKGSA